MSPDEFIAVSDAQIVGLELQSALPDDFLRALPRQLGTVLETPTFAIGGWENPADGPLVLGLDASGQMVSLVSVNPTQADSLAATLASIDEWLSTMTLRSLSELSGNSVEFYEGLLELSPYASLVLSPRRRFVLLTAMAELDAAGIAARLPESDVEVHYLDVLQGPDGRAIIRGRSTQVVEQAPPLPVPEPTVAEEPITYEPIFVDQAGAGEEAAEVEPTASTEEFSVAAAPSEQPAEPSPEHIDLTEQDEFIDLSSDIHPPAFAADFIPAIEQGGTYSLDHLPLLFDATGASLESISDEMFAVSDAIVIVTGLPERRRDTPFEDRRRFRWDTTLDRIQILNEHGFTAAGNQRVVHLFVESERQPNYAVYIGELSRTAFQTQTRIDGETAWFSISPSLQSDLYRTLRKGRLPQFDERRTVDITNM